MFINCCVVDVVVMGYWTWLFMNHDAFSSLCLFSSGYNFSPRRPFQHNPFSPFLLRPSRVFATHIILILCHILSNWFPYFKILIIDIESLDFSALSFLVLHYHILSSWGCCLESTCFSIFQSLSLHVFLFSCENFCLRNLTDDVYMIGNL